MSNLTGYICDHCGDEVNVINQIYIEREGKRVPYQQICDNCMAELVMDEPEPDCELPPQLDNSLPF